MPKRRWIWMSCVLGLAACEQRPGIAPRIDAVSPAVVAVGQERFVVLSGRFAPRVSWTPGEEPSLSAGFEVQFGDHPSDRVRLDSAERLVARVPAIDQSGCLDVIVSGPGGTTGRLADGLCLREVASSELLLGCFTDEGLGLCRFDDADDSLQLIHTDLLWATAPMVRLGYMDVYRRAYLFSPDGRRLLFMREILDEPDQGDLSWRDRQVVLRDMQAGWELILAESRQPPPDGPEAQEGFESFSEPAFSPDGAHIAYVQDTARLVIRPTPEDPTAVPPARVVVDWTDQPGVRVGYPDFDIASTQVLFTRAVTGPQAIPPGEVNLYLAPLDGSRPAADLFPEAPAGEWNGPGSFHPDGGAVVFVSARMGMQVSSPFLITVSATNLFRLELANGRVEAVTVPIAGVFTGAPVMSPDGRLAANTGFIDELAGRTLDVLLTDLDRGRTSRLGPDRGPFCYPRGESVCQRDDMSGCCYWAEGGTEACCSMGQPEQCPTFDILPAFAPDSRLLVANYLPWLWYCFADDNAAPAWSLAFIQFGVFLGMPIEDQPGAWGELPIPTGELGLAFGAFGPLVRQTLVGE